jgi:hypothetical protein
MVLPDECELVSVGHQTPEPDLGNVRAVLLGAMVIPPESKGLRK